MPDDNGNREPYLKPHGDDDSDEKKKEPILLLMPPFLLDEFIDERFNQ